MPPETQNTIVIATATSAAVVIAIVIAVVAASVPEGGAEVATATAYVAANVAQIEVVAEEKEMEGRGSLVALNASLLQWFHVQHRMDSSIQMLLVFVGDVLLLWFSAVPQRAQRKKSLARACDPNPSCQ